MSTSSPAQRRTLAAALLAGAAACSSADAGVTSPVFHETTDESTSGGGSSSTDPATSQDTAPESTGAASQGETGGTSGAEDPPPDDATPQPTDEIEPKNVPEAPACDPLSALTWRVALRDSSAMSAPAQARDAMLSAWPMLGDIDLDPWQFLNYYTFSYPPAPPGTLAGGAQLRLRSDDLGDRFDLQIALRSPDLTPGERPPVHLTLALDNSGSMEGLGLELLRAAGMALASQLREGDTAAVVSWRADGPVLLPTTVLAGPNDPALLGALMQFELGGTAEFADGLDAALKMASEVYAPGDINRIAVITDGGAALTTADLDLIASKSADEPGQPGIHFIGVGVGAPELYRADLIHTITAAGKGPALFIGSENEAKRQLAEHFLRLVGLAGLDVAVRLTPPPGLLLEATDEAGIAAPPETIFLAPNDVVVLHRTLRPCVTPLAPDAGLALELSWTDPVSGEVGQSVAEWPIDQLLAGSTAELAKGDAVLAYVDALKAEQSGAVGQAALDAAKEALAAAQLLLPADGDLKEVAQVLAVLGEP